MLKAGLMIIAMSVGFQAQAAAADDRLANNLPSDVADFLIRRAACLDWISKLQAEHGAVGDYEESLSALRCGAISSQQQTLRERYALQPDVVAALDQVWIKVVRRVPVSPGKPEPVVTAPR